MITSQQHSTQTVVFVESYILLQAEIEKMVKDAEAHAAEDRKRRDLIEAKNNADSAIYRCEVTLATSVSPASRRNLG